MKIVATADLHGHLPRIPECDVLVIAGDVLPLNAERGRPAWSWLERQFKPWLEYVPAKEIIGIAGNHDFAFEANPTLPTHLPWRYLLDSGCEINGVKFWGTPWVPNLEGWAYYAPSDKLNTVYEAISDDTDVVVSHGPPVRHVSNKLHPEWCSFAVNTMLKRVRPLIFICGHIHEGYGVERSYCGHTDLYNVAHSDITYSPVNPPVSNLYIPTSQRTR